MTVYLVGAGPGDPGLLTRRGASLLRQADVVIYDRLVHRSVLALAPASAELIDVGKRPGATNDSARQEQINELLVEHGRRSPTVVRLKGGDPFVFGRGGEEVEILSKAGIPWEVVPGVTSAFGVAAAAGIPVTHRGLASSVTVVTGRVGATTGPADIDWEALAKVEGTLVVLMGMRTRGEIADALQRGGKDPDTAVAVIEQGTTPAQRTIRTTLARLRDVELGSPAVIVIGPVAALGDAIWSGGAGPLGGRTVVVTRSGPRAYELVDALWHVGARVVELPLTAQIGPADDGASLRAAVAELETYDWVVFTSANAVERMMAELRDARQFGPARVAAVGPATADALRRAGIEPDLVPAEHRAQGLLDEFPACEGAQAGRVLFPSADLAPSTVPDGLGQKGWEVTRIEAYRTVASADAEPGLLAEAAAADAVTFAASSAVRAYLALRTPEGEPLAVPPVVVCLGPSTADTARAAGLNGVLEAEGATTLGTVAVLIDRLGEGPSGGS